MMRVYNNGVNINGKQTALQVVTQNGNHVTDEFWKNIVNTQRERNKRITRVGYRNMNIIHNDETPQLACYSRGEKRKLIYWFRKNSFFIFVHGMVGGIFDAGRSDARATRAYCSTNLNRSTS